MVLVCARNASAYSALFLLHELFCMVSFVASLFLLMQLAIDGVVLLFFFIVNRKCFNVLV